MNLTMTQPKQPLGQLIDGLEPSHTDLPSKRNSHLTVDSREVSSGSLFLGVPGEKTDGRRFVDQALRAGAAAVLVEGREWDANQSSRAVSVDDSASRSHCRPFPGSPSHALCVIGITGTNGKTTCASSLRRWLLVQVD